MPEPLELTGDGDADELEAEQAPEGKKKRKRGGDEAPGARTRRRHEGELRNRLELVFERLAEWLEGRGDGELAGVIREDSKAMTGGLISLTRPLAWLRPPIIAALSVVEPVLAFGRVARIVAGRLAERRARAREARAGAAAEGPSVPWAELTDDELAAWQGAGHPDAAAELERRQELYGVHGAA